MSDYYIIDSIKKFATNHLSPLVKSLDPMQEKINEIAQHYMPSKTQMYVGGSGLTLMAMMGNRTTRKGLFSTISIGAQLSTLILTAFIFALYSTYKTAEGTTTLMGSAFTGLKSMVQSVRDYLNKTPAKTSPENKPTPHSPVVSTTNDQNVIAQRRIDRVVNTAPAKESPNVKTTNDWVSEFTQFMQNRRERTQISVEEFLAWVEKVKTPEAASNEATETLVQEFLDFRKQIILRKNRLQHIVNHIVPVSKL